MDKQDAAELQPLSMSRDVELATIVDIARRYPRSLGGFLERAKAMATVDVETAQGCFYRLKRTDRRTKEVKWIEGPSIRLAEIVALSYGNIRFGGRVVEYGERDVVARGYACDIERLVYCDVEVRRRIVDRDGRRYSDDMLVLTGNAAMAIAIRNALFRVVPLALVKPVYDLAKRTAVGDAKTLGERRTKMIQAFAAMGIGLDKLLAYCGISSPEDVTLAHIEDLIGVHNAIRDGEISADEAFAVEEERPAPATIQEDAAETMRTLRKRMVDPTRPAQGVTDTPAESSAPPKPASEEEPVAEAEEREIDVTNAAETEAPAKPSRPETKSPTGPQPTFLTPPTPPEPSREKGPVSKEMTERRALVAEIAKLAAERGIPLAQVTAWVRKQMQGELTSLSLIQLQAVKARINSLGPEERL